MVTGDIQTVSWICIHYMPSELVNAQDAPQAWITSYRKLLEAWAMFVDRAAYDNACYSANINKPIMQQVYVSCNYCGKPVSKHTYGMPEGAIPGKIFPPFSFIREFRVGQGLLYRWTEHSILPMFTGGGF